MTHFNDFSALRTHRTFKYDSLALLETIAKLHSFANPLNGISNGVVEC